MGGRFRSVAAAILSGLAAVTAGGTPAGAVGNAATAAPAFAASIEPISNELVDEMVGVSWRPGCPVPISDLRLITMNHWGFDGELHRGELVVHADVADDIVTVFGEMYAARFPILRMERIENYGGDDDASMAADNTSAFNCREITGGGAMSRALVGQGGRHQSAREPVRQERGVLPPAGEAFLDRGDVRPGMIVDGDVVTTAFASIGFVWGGDWTRLKDYQHFEASSATSGAAAPGAGAVCPTYTENPGTYPVKVCQRGLAVENVQRQLVRHGYDVDIDGYFGPQTRAAVRRFQSDHGLEVDGLVGPITWPALLAGAGVGTDADGDGAVEPWEIPGPAAWVLAGPAGIRPVDR